jgi:hypothetical protein
VNCSDAMAEGSTVSGSISLKDDDYDPIEMRRRGLRHDFWSGSDSVNYCEADNTNHRGNGEIFGSQMHYRPCYRGYKLCGQLSPNKAK